MPNHKSAKKRVKTNEKANERNRKIRSSVRTAIKSVRKEDDKKAAEDKLKKALVVIDKATQKGIYHKNNAARKKSRLVSHVSKLQESK